MTAVTALVQPEPVDLVLFDLDPDPDLWPPPQQGPPVVLDSPPHWGYPGLGRACTQVVPRVE